MDKKTDFIRLIIEDVFYGYFTKGILSNGQTICMFFIQQRTYQDLEFSVFLAIANKKKHIREWMLGTRDVLSDKSTGKCGLEGLIWGKTMLNAFEKKLEMEYPNGKEQGKVAIVICPTDSRRKKVYVHGLKKNGYAIANRWGCPCLYKKIA
ncbi:hypothetical protein [Paenibacillus polymyxa]|uniref:Uncharacterized protein n=1 Tax=Paenibacillus polymyxa (strain SC2) TaxID=886882 RepID=E3EK24_PAEPS|nr:hypothetical protein [Paenibacillus polymyxa]ADO59733.1 hypothetical protein PPSC2_26515 [Paenibacillus polymyxa SC2]WPQ60032.1 hypothetical protein SKN87_27705 [Paenibacillus polymyxa]